jgi:transcriptional regulator with XRE-family HTH domain
MDKRITQKFLVELDKQIEISGLSQNKIAKKIGYASGGASIQNIRNGTTQVKLEKLKNFCNLFNYDLEFFINEENYNTIDHNSINEIAEIAAIYKSEKIDNIEIIERQFSKIEKTEDFLISMLENGLNLLRQMKSDTILLKEFVGSK